jgi:hypothetical protein
LGKKEAKETKKSNLKIPKKTPFKITRKKKQERNRFVLNHIK